MPEAQKNLFSNLCNALPLEDVLEDGADEVEEDLNDDADEELDTNTLHLSDTETERNKKSMPYIGKMIVMEFYYKSVCISAQGSYVRKRLHRHLLRR